MFSKHLLVTAPKIYAKRFEDAMSRSCIGTDIKITYMPLISTHRLEDMAEMKIFLNDILSYDFVAFCSRKAIECFAEYITEQGVILPRSIGFCAIGRDNEALESLNITPAFIASEASPQGIVDWFERHTKYRGCRIAVLSPIVEGLKTPDTVPMFIEGLQSVGLNVTEVGCYITRRADVSRELRLMVDSLDGVVFSSGAEVEVFIDSVGVEGLNLEYLVFGPYTAMYAQKLGLSVSLVNRDFDSFAEFIENIKRFYKI